MREMDKLLLQYAEKFEDNFPIFFVNHLGEAEIKELIKKAIRVINLMRRNIRSR